MSIHLVAIEGLQSIFLEIYLCCPSLLQSNICLPINTYFDVHLVWSYWSISICMIDKTILLVLLFLQYNVLIYQHFSFKNPLSIVVFLLIVFLFYPCNLCTFSSMILSTSALTVITRHNCCIGLFSVIELFFLFDAFPLLLLTFKILRL